MLNSVKNRLIFLYTISTGIILSISLIVSMMLSEQREVEEKIKNFSNQLSMITNQLETQSKISYTFMAEIEVKNELILLIEDNGIPLSFPGVFHLETNRTELIQKVKENAGKEGISSDSKPISTRELRSPIFKLKGEKGEEYCGSMVVTPVSDGYWSIVLLQHLKGGSQYRLEKMPQTLSVIILNLIGVGALFLVSRWFVNKSLLPVEESRKRQINFVASASHELRSPLAVIRANSSLISQNPEQALFFSDGIERECKRMARLIEDLLFLASVDGENWSLKKEEVSIDTLLIDTYELFSSLFKAKGMKLTLALQEEPLPVICGDTERLQQILAILLDNGMSYAASGNEIVLRGYEGKKEIMLEVEDHGNGIPDEKKQEIFRRFYRMDKARKDKNHFGLGLSIAHELTTLMNADISIRDTPGGGTTFVIKLQKHKSDKL